MAKHEAEKLFSFAQWAADHPSDQIPGDRVDIQFDNHRLAIESLAQAIRRLVRADGKLNHDLLTTESFPRELTTTLIDRAKREVEAFVGPVYAVTGQHQGELEAAQLDLRARLDEIRHYQRHVQAALARQSDLQNEVETRVRAAMQQIDRSLRDNAAVLEDVNWQTLQANTAEDWASVSTHWAEYMDGNATIPPNILASNSITGDHWSSRWWANRAASAFGMLAWWYMGAWPGPPPSTPQTPTGQPIPPGAMYFDTITGKMYVWNGSGWVTVAQGPAAATTSSLYYLATAGQTVFPLGTPDLNARTFAFNQALPEGLHALVNGVRIIPTTDYTVNVAASTVTMLRPLPVNAVVTFDILTPTSQLIPSGTVNTVLLSPIVPDGVKVAFTGLTVASNGHAVNVAKNEELLVSVDGVQQAPGLSYNATGASITFSEAPYASSAIFIVWFGPPNP